MSLSQSCVTHVTVQSRQSDCLHCNIALLWYQVLLLAHPGLWCKVTSPQLPLTASNPLCRVDMTGGHLPECFEMEERTSPGVGDVLQLVSGRQLLGFVRERSDGQLAGEEQQGIAHGCRSQFPERPRCKCWSVSALELTAVLQCLGGNHIFTGCGPVQAMLYGSLCRPDTVSGSPSVMASLTGHLKSSSLHVYKPRSTKPKLLLKRA